MNNHTSPRKKNSWRTSICLLSSVESDRRGMPFKPQMPQTVGETETDATTLPDAWSNNVNVLIYVWRIKTGNVHVSCISFSVLLLSCTRFTCKWLYAACVVHVSFYTHTHTSATEHQDRWPAPAASNRLHDIHCHPNGHDSTIHPCNGAHMKPKCADPHVVGRRRGLRRTLAHTAPQSAMQV